MSWSRSVGRASAFGLGAIVLLATVAIAQAPQAGSAEIDGRVIDVRGAPLSGVPVTLRGESMSSPIRSKSGSDGRFRFPAVPAPGRYALTLASATRESAEVVVSSGEKKSVSLVFEPSFFEQLTVTGSREAEPISRTPASVGVIDRAAIQAVRPTHPGQLLGQIAGVWVNTTGGEGHQTAIRQPLTTNPVYLYLEDGVPTRSTGFFNHNALYEINVPMADSVEVTKGPGSALYGSDAIGGIVNVVTRSPFAGPTLDAALDAGSFGWKRALVSGSLSGREQAARLDVNVTQSDGWRDSTGYERESVGLRWDRTFESGSYVKTVVAYSHVDQETAGSSAIPRALYDSDPRLNLTPISFRKVDAFRASTDWELQSENTFVSVTPYFRRDSMGLLPNWTLTFEPTVYTDRNDSYGVLARVRRSVPSLHAEVTAGVDGDWSPGSRVEDTIVPRAEPGPQGTRIFTSYAQGVRIYDYDVTFRNAAPYVQAEVRPAPNVTATLGLRYDWARYDYDDHLDGPAPSRFRRPPDGSVEYDSVSPKVGVVWQALPNLGVFASWRSGFRVPSQSQVFRQGSALETLSLEPVKAGNADIGVRAALSDSISLEVVGYRLEKRDDILTYRNPLDGATEAVNNGRTLHTGVEVQLAARPLSWLNLAAAYSHAKHTYEEWVVDPAGGVDFSGKEIESAPRDMANVIATYEPAFLGGARASVEWVLLGSYWMDPANTHRYEGHHLWNVRLSAPVTPALEAYASVRNLTDRRWAENASFTIQRGEELAPGAPRSFGAGVRFTWGGR
jgi:outer membrane receptor protein involved in Fe transport